MRRHDYNICPDNEDHKHGPIVGIWDRDCPAGHVSVQCEACGTTTGFIIPAELEWN